LVVIAALLVARSKHATKVLLAGGRDPDAASGDTASRYGNAAHSSSNGDDGVDDGDSDDAAARKSALFRRNSVSIKVVKDADGAMTLVEHYDDDDGDELSESDSLDDDKVSDDSDY
jgi:hypothetical protein